MNSERVASPITVKIWSDAWMDPPIYENGELSICECSRCVDRMPPNNEGKKLSGRECQV